MIAISVSRFSLIIPAADNFLKNVIQLKVLSICNKNSGLHVQGVWRESKVQEIILM